MTTLAQHARHQLEAHFGPGYRIPFVTQGTAASTADARRSAVLILFGQLDEVPAIASATAAVDAAGHATDARPVVPELDVLLTRRSNTMRAHAGQIAFPGGGSEPSDASPAATALREANEETGLDPTGVDVLGTLPDIYIPVSNNLVTPVIGWWRRPSEIAADNTESTEVFRVPVAELIDPTHRGTSVLRVGHQTYYGPAFRLASHFGGHLVWGFTAMLLAGVFDSLGWAVAWDADRRFEVAR